jgi:hypothetical protein
MDFTADLDNLLWHGLLTEIRQDYLACAVTR